MNAHGLRVEQFEPSGNRYVSAFDAVAQLGSAPASSWPRLYWRVYRTNAEPLPFEGKHGASWAATLTDQMPAEWRDVATEFRKWSVGEAVATWRVAHGEKKQIEIFILEADYEKACSAMTAPSTEIEIDGVRYVSAFRVVDRLRVLPVRDWPGMHWRRADRRDGDALTPMVYTSEPPTFGHEPDRENNDAWARVLKCGDSTGVPHRSWERGSPFALYEGSNHTRPYQIEIFIARDDVDDALKLKEPESVVLNGHAYVDAERAFRVMRERLPPDAKPPALYWRNAIDAGDPQAASIEERNAILRSLGADGFSGYIHRDVRTRGGESGKAPAGLRRFGFDFTEEPIEIFFRKDAYDALMATAQAAVPAASSKAAHNKRRSGITIGQMQAQIAKKQCAGKSRDEVRAMIEDFIDETRRLNKQLAQPTNATIGRWVTDRMSKAKPKRKPKQT